MSTKPTRKASKKSTSVSDWQTSRSHDGGSGRPAGTIKNSQPPSPRSLAMAASEWMRPNATRVMLYKSISHRSPPVRKRNDASREYRPAVMLHDVGESLEARLCRWLLQTHDCTDGNVIPLTAFARDARWKAGVNQQAAE
jgi:hypothetical protein